MPRSRVDMRKVRRDVEDFRFFFVPIFRTPAIALVRARRRRFDPFPVLLFLSP